ncbi:MAG TPA: VOC family protein [Terracidiphilus sp.]|jgi:catechol 2,3-dioxygenase-like lactoylglutathione lyase family enzyme|nr:VOC family protein [Terracidiphilus sp.]
MHWKVSAALLAVSTAVTTLAAQSVPARPRITGVSHLAIYAKDMAATDRYFVQIVGAVKMPDPENARGVKYALSATQYVEVLPLPAGAGINRMDHAAYNTVSAEGLRTYLAGKGWKTPAKVNKGTDGSLWFAVHDPEGNTIEFVRPVAGAKVDAPRALGHHIIHVGYVVHDRAKEDTFYRGLLGFRPYWYGGEEHGKTEWVSQQVPDGHDWLEYMVTDGPSRPLIPADMTQETLGVLDHLSIGEDSVKETHKKLTAEHRLGAHHDDKPEMGLDGKWQFNMYAPDGTRLELMNLHATQKPRCSPFTAADPAE